VRNGTPDVHDHGCKDSRNDDLFIHRSLLVVDGMLLLDFAGIETQFQRNCKFCRARALAWNQLQGLASDMYGKY
jgi:hypothetical protein